MATFQLVEYVPSGETYVPSGNVYSFQPLPKSVQKEVKLGLRVRNSGTKWFKIVRYRNRLTETYTIQGSTSVDKMLELQHYIKRQGSNLKVKFKINTDVNALKVMKEEASSPTFADPFFVIVDSSFSIPSGKSLSGSACVDYTITLELVA